MKSPFRFLPDLLRITAATVTVFASAALTLAGDDQPATASKPMRLMDLIGRPVIGSDGANRGSLTDVLVQMPSGLIVFVLVQPKEMFAEPKAVPPGALKLAAEKSAPLQLGLPLDQWISAPRLDWDPKLIVKDTNNGAEIYGYYQQRWLDTAPSSDARGLEVVAPPKDAPVPSRFVSLNNILLHRISAPGWDAPGFVRGFLLDWHGQRATHALISQLFTAAPAPDEVWFAVPIPLISPPVNEDALLVNTTPEAFRNTPPLSSSSQVPLANYTQIFTYPAARDADENSSASSNHEK